ncbi:acyl carrier protein [Paroceanicella profunda]|uniref:acyl carrier protein n=1 Tax=Paroceanicella profunda TaxID=2579971 RepID=UPI001EF07BB0|nr:acyl carrier protein [Paroceanicella profunda]
MDTEALLGKISEIIVDVLDLDDLSPESITRETTADDVEGWDSLQHVRILTSIERSFGFRFASDEIAELRDVGELVDRVATKIA